MNIADVERILNNYDPAPPPDCWFDSLDCPQLVADVYNRSVAVYSETAGNTLYLPFRSELPETFKPIMLLLRQVEMQHWYLIGLEKKNIES
ncbi:hypothetical protein RMATCC62417_06188 [Rhizopus microsporus]|nr:hypothetical protein RMATCC62417_06188 [Rhizopus microsporus]